MSAPVDSSQKAGPVLHHLRTLPRKLPGHVLADGFEELLALTRHVADHFKVGAGCNFAEFSGDLIDDTCNVNGLEKIKSAEHIAHV